MQRHPLISRATVDESIRIPAAFQWSPIGSYHACSPFSFVRPLTQVKSTWALPIATRPHLGQEARQLPLHRLWHFLGTFLMLVNLWSEISKGREVREQLEEVEIEIRTQPNDVMVMPNCVLQE